MGQLPGLNKLNTKPLREDLLSADKNDIKKVVVLEEEPALSVKTNTSVVNDIKTERHKDKKIKRHIDIKSEKNTTQFKIVQCMVSSEFKTAVAVYCTKNDYKEIELIREALESVLNGEPLNSNVYNTTAKGSEASKMLYGRYDSRFKKEVALYALSNGITEGYLVAQTVAQKIDWKKFL